VPGRCDGSLQKRDCGTTKVTSGLSVMFLCPEVPLCPLPAYEASHSKHDGTGGAIGAGLADDPLTLSDRGCCPNTQKPLDPVSRRFPEAM
jgi:hypothetical protein